MILEFICVGGAILLLLGINGIFTEFHKHTTKTGLKIFENSVYDAFVYWGTDVETGDAGFVHLYSGNNLELAKRAIWNYIWSNHIKFEQTDKRSPLVGFGRKMFYADDKKSYVPSKDFQFHNGIIRQVISLKDKPVELVDYVLINGKRSKKADLLRDSNGNYYLGNVGGL